MSDDWAALCARYAAIVELENFGADPAERVLLWLRLSADAQRVFGALNELTLFARFGVARARRALDDKAGAQAEADAVLTLQRSTLGERHPATLQTRMSLALWRGSDGEIACALGELDTLIPALEEAFGHDSENALYARNARGAWTSGDASLVERVSEATVLVDDQTRGLGAAHRLTVHTTRLLADLQEKWRNWLIECHGLAMDLLADMELDKGNGEVSAAGRAWADISQLDSDAQDRVLEDSAEVSAEAEALLLAVTEAKRGVSLANRTFGNDSEAALGARYEVARAFLGGQEDGFADAHRCASALSNDCVRVLGEHHRLTELVRRLREHAATNQRGDVPAYVVEAAAQDGD